MQPLDWAVLAAYCIIPIGIAVYFSRRAGKTMESFLVADRSLPWFVLGVSAFATYTSSGASSAFSMLVYKNGIAGNWVWWMTWIIWMPLVSALWSRYWRRLGIVTTAEFIQARYAGRPASVFRAVYAVFMALGWATLLNGYITGWLVSSLGPVFGVDPSNGTQVLTLLVVCVGMTGIYAVMSGAFSATYNDIPQMAVYMLANIIFVPIALSAAGGLERIYETIQALPPQTIGNATMVGGSEFFDPLPPAGGISGVALIALIVNGFFYAAAPAGGEGYTAQLFMSAKNEFHAQVGQLMNSILSLLVRVLPLIFLGLAAAALYRPMGLSPDLAWGRLIADHGVAGLTGLLIAAELAAFMSTIDTQINWATSYIVNDAYKPMVKPNADPKHYVRVCRISNLVFMVLSVALGYYIATGGEGMNRWFNGINGGLIAFILPLSWLRFFWWRFNVWGEISALVIGFPLGITLWLTRPWDLGDWEMALLLFGCGFVTQVTVTLLTPAEPMEKLKAFYIKCRPPGWWGPVAESLSPDERAAISKETGRGILHACLGIFVCGGLVVTMCLLFARWYAWAAGSAALALVSACLLLRAWIRSGVLAKLREPA